MSELAKKLTFEEALLQRIQSAIGELMPEEDLKRIVHAGVEKALFEPRITTNNYGNKTTEPSLVDKAVTTFLGDQMSVAVAEWIKQNPAALQAAVDKAIKDGAASCVMQSLDQRFSWIFSSLMTRPGAKESFRATKDFF